ncbi:hypothetical protein C8R46DRAFT_1224650 [Mycena filopes]|nr:hypothetical protein C8R46DRAFT_1224650 [Mycena filopes]
MSPAPKPPAMTAVNSSPNEDIQGKLRIYGAISAMRDSRMPSNAQITQILHYAKTYSPVDEKRLSTDGKTLISDIRDILSTFSRSLEDKNQGELLQRFVWSTRGVDTSSVKPKDGDKKQANAHVDQAKSDAAEANKHLRTLLNIILTNGEARKLVADAGTIGRDLLAKGAGKAAESLAPKPDQLERADDTAPHDHFVDSDPLASGKAKADKVKATADNTKAAVATSDSEVDSDDSDVVDPKSSSGKDVKNSLLGRVKALHSSNKPVLDDGRAWLTNEYFPESRRERWIWRGKKVIIECQRHADYQESVRWLLDAVDAWAARAMEAGPCFAFLPLSSFAPFSSALAGAPLDPIFDAARVLAQDSANDEGLRNWWKNVDGYVRKPATSPSRDPRLVHASCGTLGRTFYDGKYKGHFEAVMNATSGWFKSFADDPLNKALAQDFARLTRDLLFDGDGNLQFKKKLWEDVRNVILPTLVDTIGFIPIPRIEYTDDSFEVIVENLTLSGRHLFPNIVEVEAHNHMRFSPYTAAGKGDASRHEFTFTFAQIHADMRDVAFSFRTKTGIKMNDSGLADVVLGGEGLSATVTLTSSKDTSSVFNVANVRVKVGSLKFRLRDTKHDLLYKTFKPLATRLIKTQLKKAIADAIRTGFEYIDGQLVGVRDRMEEAKGTDDESRRQVLAEMFKRKKEDAVSVVSDSKASNAQFKVVASKDKSLMPQSGHPDGWVNRTAEKKEQQQAVDETNDWRSTAFDIPSQHTTNTSVNSSVPVGRV